MHHHTLCLTFTSYRYVLPPTDTANEGFAAEGGGEGREMREGGSGGRRKEGEGVEGRRVEGREERGGEGSEEVWIEKRGRMEVRAGREGKEEM